ncbi:hypothetical protein AAFG07_20825 [Bradyrhizobium sp. B097]|uniref:hypothetical protein n=1 Tax=Bradyrhizobium sp. B097 TaxID=3140244 RepID=UPI003183721A
MAEMLAISREIILAPTPVDLDAIAALMLWPHDPAQRDQSIKTSRVETGHSIQEFLAADDLRSLTTLAKDALPLALIQKQMPEPFGHGVRSGFYLQRAVASVARGKPETLGKMVKELAAIEPKIRDEKTFANTYWPRYRPVAHFWASAIDFADGGTLPCRAANLLEFLQRAEGYRVLGEKSSTKQAPRPILRSGETVQIDTSLKIEPAILRF